jgi:hypothetical protein
MKRFFTMLLTLCLAASLALPAQAAVMQEQTSQSDLEGELLDLTAHVKDVLGVDDAYTSFYSDYSDGLSPSWYLSWSDDTRDLSVTCRTDGTITEVYAWQTSQENDWFYGFDPAFPALDETTAQRQAQMLLEKLMGDGERARVDSVRADMDEGSYRFTGRVMINGLESPITFSLTLTENGLQYYSRSDWYKGYVGSVPVAQTQVDKGQAASSLQQAVAMELYYVNNGSEARLTYVPVGAYTVVDAQTGEAVDMDALYASFGGTYEGVDTAYAMETASAADTADSGWGLTEVELTSIANYGDVLTQEALDEAVRQIPALGLESFSLQRCSYAMDSEGTVTASLRYTATMTADNLFGYSGEQFEEYSSWGEDLTVYKTITVEAQTGQIQAVSTSYPLYQQDGSSLSDTAQAATTQAFLSQVAPELYAQSGQCTLQGYDDGNTYVQVVDGYFYPDNYLYVSLNPATATVDTYSYNWDDTVTFAAAQGIVLESQAVEAYTQALTVTLGYAAWPESLDPDDVAYATYREWGYSYAESLRLGYYYNGLDRVTGVDALTGQAVTKAETASGVYTYEDVADPILAQQAQALAQAGIGLAGGALEPEAPVTYRQAVTLLLQTAGFTVTDWEDDRLQSVGQSQGFLPAGDWKPEDTVTAMDFVRMLLGPSRYNAAAQLTAAWTAMEGVSDADRGYAAIAAALGMIQTENFDPQAVCTHQEAVQMLYGFLSR